MLAFAEQREPMAIRVEKNGVTVAFGDPGKGKNGTTTVTGLQKNADGSYSAEATVTIRPGQSGAELDSTVGHEGTTCRGRSGLCFHRHATGVLRPL